jgi:hypothetical protein
MEYEKISQIWKEKVVDLGEKYNVKVPHFWMVARMFFPPSRDHLIGMLRERYRRHRCDPPLSFKVFSWVGKIKPAQRRPEYLVYTTGTREFIEAGAFSVYVPDAFIILPYSVYVSVNFCSKCSTYTAGNVRCDCV